MNFPLNKHYRQLSKGQQGLFQIILAVCSNARYLLLDEPFDGLDIIIKGNDWTIDGTFK